ncbi:MAG: hypothetical protein KAX57_09440 [Rhodoferax sp.]|nr:hypothetical protein [Rhodoferax sp.]
MINVERDGSGRTYQIWKQNQMNSCGIACMWMARGIARQTSFSEEEWGLAGILLLSVDAHNDRPPIWTLGMVMSMSNSTRASTAHLTV